MVTIALVLTHRQKSLMSLVYFAGDFAGTIGEMTFLWTLSLYKKSTFITFGMIVLGTDTEGVINFILMTVILALLDEIRQILAIGYGGTFPARRRCFLGASNFAILISTI